MRNKEKACEKSGIAASTYRLSADTAQSELIALIEKLNSSADVHGILVQLPLPAQIETQRVLEAISPLKDVDGFHPYNAGKLLQSSALLEPCTPKGCIRLIKTTGIELSGKNAVVIGRSNLVGKPLAVMLERENCTVTLCHSKTKDLEYHLKNADIVVCAVGKARILDGSFLKPGCTVIDVGINRLSDGTVCGDVDFDSAAEKAAFITPVPGGVGPMTIAMLLENTIIAAEAFNA